MILKTLFVRFYKSFNYDYLKKVQDKADPRPWELIDGAWFPYVTIPIDTNITTVVGANESGKSHLLTAVEKGISGEGIKAEDFCRYSEFFSVDRDQIKTPDIGFEWSDLTESEITYIRSACKIDEETVFDRFLIFRTNRSQLTVFLPTNSEYTEYKVHSGDFKEIFPAIFTIDPDVALPDSVSIHGLATNFEDSGSSIESLKRSERFGLLESLSTITGLQAELGSAEMVQQYAPQIHQQLAPTLGKIKLALQDEKEMARRKAENKLAYDLICKVANVDPQSILELYESIKNEKEGHANGIIQKINDNLEKNLNFPKWWVQDQNFKLIVTSRENELVFTIRDRTDTDYSFSERSSGLKYFLSYYVQYRAHEPVAGRREILLMDEPDTYLSSQAQQDLLKIFDAFAFPEENKEPVQVIFVTHSPFLIDKNHGERIRVLEKGAADEGTRIVKDAAKNHYEPLRSAFGAFVGETSFIGNCNIMLEGLADQVLLAGAATFIRRKGKLDGSFSNFHSLDLNTLTLVPAGSASQIPYLVYLARGRGEEQPAVVVLLDSDTAGNDAKKTLGRGGAYNKQLLKAEYILQIGDLASEDVFKAQSDLRLIEIEDLIPIPLCVQAAQKYALEICGLKNADIHNISLESVKKGMGTGAGVFTSIETIFKSLSKEGCHIEKVGFARTVLYIVNSTLDGQNPRVDGLDQFVDNFKALFEKLNSKRRMSERELASEKVSQKIKRIRKSFIQDHPQSARKEDGSLLLENMQAALDDTSESVKVRTAIHKLQVKHDLNNDHFSDPIPEYEKFKEDINAIVYANRIATEHP